MEEELRINKSQRDAILNYLQKRPYEEVYQLIAMLVQLKEAPKKKKVE